MLQLTLLALVRPALTALSPNNHCTLCFWLVRIWDTVGEDQTLKGEYKVISGKMCDLFVLNLNLRAQLMDENIATTSSGMAKASASSPSVMGKKSACASNTFVVVSQTTRSQRLCRHHLFFLALNKIDSATHSCSTQVLRQVKLSDTPRCCS